MQPEVECFEPLTPALLAIAVGVAFLVTGGTCETGVRVALEASLLRVLKDILGDALKLVVPGIGLGVLLLSMFLGAVW